MSKLDSIMVSIDITDKEDIRSGLITLCDIDGDMNGDNGEEYLWEEAKGYENNAEYLADLVMKDFDNVINVIELFVEKWMEHDTYYEDHAVEILNVTPNIIVVSLAAVH